MLDVAGVAVAGAVAGCCWMLLLLDVAGCCWCFSFIHSNRILLFDLR